MEVNIGLTSGRQLTTATSALLPRLPHWLVRCLRPLIKQSVGEQLALVDTYNGIPGVFVGFPLLSGQQRPGQAGVFLLRFT